MLSTKARPQLDTLVRQLKEWEESVPRQARRFHDIRAQLDGDIRGAIPVWAFWVADDAVQRFRDRVERLRILSTPVMELIRECETLADEVRRLRDAGPASDAELTAWLQKRTRDWLALLGRLGANCEREGDVAADRVQHENAEATVRLHHEAVHQLIEAAAVLNTVGTDVRAAGLAGLLPDLRRRLFTGGATPEWLDEIRSFVQPLRTVASRIQDPPRELNDAAAILTELRSWWELLQGSEEERRAIESIEERRFRVADWEQEEAQELVVDAQRLREQLLERVGQTRSGILRELEQGLADLRRACGDQADLTARLAELSGRQSHRPPLFRDWLSHADKFRHSFKAVAQTHILALEHRLTETREGITAKLDELQHRLLSDAVRNDVVIARDDLAGVRDATDVEEILQALRALNEITWDVEALDQRAREDLRAVAQAQEELAAKHERLVAELTRVRGVELDLSNFAHDLAALHEHAAERSLEEHRGVTASLVERLDTLEAEFIARCRTRLDEHRHAAQRAHDILLRAEASPPALDIRSIDDLATPQDAATAVIDARRQQNVLLRLARTMRDDLEDRRTQACANLQNIRPDNLGPADRQRAAQLLQQLADVAQTHHRSLIDALEAMSSVIENCERFFDALQQEQRSARERLAELRRLFREFADDQLPRFCPELSDRVAALIYGVPDQPRQWSAVHHQLDRAAELFARVRLHAQRLAADEVDRAADALRARIRTAVQTGFRDAAQQALAELDACGTDRLAPAALRQRVVNISQRRV